MKLKHKSKHKPRRRKHFEPRWKVIVLWIYLIIMLFLFWAVVYAYQFPPDITFQHKQGNFIHTYTCIMYKKAAYCCESHPMHVYVNLNASDNVSDYSYKSSECYKMEVDKG